jgi:transcriptional regulator with XRE-family HTH domain
MALGEILREAIDAAGLTQREVARVLGIEASAVSQWISNKTKPNPKYIPRLSILLKLDPAIFLRDAGPMLSLGTETEVRGSHPVHMPPEAQMPRDVPIHGVAAASDDLDNGAFNLEAGIIDYGRRTPALMNARDLYGLYVATDSMEPVYRRGTLLYVRTRLPARPGDDIIIQLKPERDGDQPPAFVKRLVSRTASKITVEQFNPPGQIEIPADRIYEIHRVLRPEEILGS